MISSHSNTEGLVRLAHDKLLQAYRALSQLCDALSSDGTIGSTPLWDVMAQAEFWVAEAVQAVSAAFEGSVGQGAVDQLKALADTISDALRNAKAMISKASEEAAEGRAVAGKSTALCESILSQMAVTGQL